MKHIYIFIAVCILCSSCKEKQPKGHVEYSDIDQIHRSSLSYTNIDVNHAKVIRESEFFNKFVDKITYIPLDNKVPIKLIDKIDKYEGNYYILSEDKIVIFDKSGKYVRTIDYKGHGHNEYFSLHDFQIIPDENVILGIDDNQRRIFKFSLGTGKSLGSVDEVAGSPFTRKIGKYYYHSFLFGNDGNLRDSHQLVISDGKNIISQQFKTAPISEQALVENNLYDYKNSVGFIPLYSDTVYTIDKNLSYHPKYVVNHKKSLWELKDQRLAVSDVIKLVTKQGYSYLSASQFFETRKGVVFCIKYGCKYGVFSRYYCYNKKDKQIFEVKTDEFESKIKCIFPGKLAFLKDNILCGYYYNLTPWKCLLNSNRIYQGKLCELIKQSNESDNPILIEMKLK